MNKPSIDFSRYSLDDLESALEGIDQERYPENHRAILAAIEALKAKTPGLTTAQDSKEISKRGERISDRHIPKPLEYTRTEEKDGTVEICHRRSLMALAPAGILLFIAFKTLSSPEFAPPGLFSTFTLLSLVALASWFVAGRFSATLGKDRMIVRFGAFKMVKRDVFDRNDIRYVTYVEDNTGDGRTWYLKLGTVPERTVGGNGDREGTYWLGREITLWAGVDYYRKTI